MKATKQYIEEFNIENLNPYEKNSKLHGRDQVEMICKSIEEYGFINPILIDENSEIIAGHGRLMAAKKLKRETAPVLIISGLTEDQKKAYRIADNKLTELGEWDMDLLNQELKELKLSGFDVDLTGFDYEIPEDPNEIKDDNFEEEDPNNVQTVIKEGDLYQIGDLMITCGSATDKNIVTAMTGGEKIACVFTDPPYGVSYKGTNNPNGREWDIIINDELRGDDLFNLLKDTFQVISDLGEEKIPVYSCYASVNHKQFESALNVAGFRVKQQIIWHKHHILGRSDYHWTHEPIMYCCRHESNCNYYGDRKQKTFIKDTRLQDIQDKTKDELIEIIKEIQRCGDVWEEKKDAPGTYIHPTQKPISLPARALINGSQKGDLIYEPFGGSGSTIMAGLQLKRKVIATELDPRYVQVILERVKAFYPELEIKCLNRSVTQEQILNRQ